MSGKLRKKNIHDRTEKYLKDYRQDYDCYINELLGQELDYASRQRQEDGTSCLRRFEKPVHTLAMTVGESFQPLLQTVCVFKPKHLLFILNKRYETTGGRNYGNRLKRFVKQLSSVTNLPEEYRPSSYDDTNFTLQVVTTDTPTDVFRALKDAFQKPETQPAKEHINVVDITGAKKSMVVGAFLYAVHSEMPITYVDFNEYNSQFSKPYGYSCKIGQIADPYKAFQLRDWERVRQLYERYNFRGARKILVGRNEQPGILGVMANDLGDGSKNKLYDDTDVKKVERLYELLDMYEQWENGEFRRAKEFAQKYSLPQNLVPWAIRELGDIWPSVSTRTNSGIGDKARHLLDEHLKLKEGEYQPQDSLFNQPTKLLAYLRDESAKVKRLIEYNEDYRSAYLRAAGLHEFLLKARLALCWLHDKVEVSVDGAASIPPSAFTDPVEQHKWFKKLVNSTAKKMLEALKNRKLILNKNNKKAEVVFLTTLPHFIPYWSSKELDFDTVVIGQNNDPVFTKLRNEAIHTHLFIPLEVAEAALKLTEAACEEFEYEWFEEFHPGVIDSLANPLVKAPSWSRLCEVCQLDFLPPKLRD